MASYSVVQRVSCLVDQPLYCSAADAGVCGERLWWWLHPLCMTQEYRLASMAAWLSSTGISHHNLLPHISLIHLLTVNSSPHPGIALQSLSSSSQPLHLLGDLHPSPGYVWLWQGLSDFIPFRLPQTSCFTLSLKCLSSDSDNCPSVGIGLLLWFSYPLRGGTIQSSTPVFPPGSFVPLSFAWSYIFWSWWWTGRPGILWFMGSQRVRHDWVTELNWYILFCWSVLLSTLSWWSACTSVSEGVFLMHPWREMYSTPTYSSAILFFQPGFFFLSKKSSTMKWIGGGWDISMNL